MGTASQSARVSAPHADITGSSITVRDIQDAVVEHFGIERVELFAKRRAKSTIRRRHIAIYLAKKLTIQSLPEIGMRFGGLDHTTILYASKKVEREMADDADLAQTIATIRQRLVERRAP